MILPSALSTRHKIRDVNIINDFVDNLMPQSLIAEKYKVSQSRISQILKSNATAIISATKDYERLKRIAFLKQALLNADIPIARNKMDINDALRKEYDIDKGIVVDNRQVFQVYLPGKEAISLNAQEAQKPVDKPLDVVETPALSTNAVE